MPTPTKALPYYKHTNFVFLHHTLNPGEILYNDPKSHLFFPLIPLKTEIEG